MSIYFDNSTVTQMRLNVTGDTVIVYPEEKEFADGRGSRNSIGKSILQTVFRQGNIA